LNCREHTVLIKFMKKVYLKFNNELLNARLDI